MLQHTHSQWGAKAVGKRIGAMFSPHFSVKSTRHSLHATIAPCKHTDRVRLRGWRPGNIALKRVRKEQVLMRTFCALYFQFHFHFHTYFVTEPQTICLAMLLNRKPGIHQTSLTLLGQMKFDPLLRESFRSLVLPFNTQVVDILSTG